MRSHLIKKGVIRLGNHMTGEKRSRGDDSRGNHRDRDRGTGRDVDRRGDGSRNEQRSEKEDVSKTVIIKGLPAHTTQSAVMPENVEVIFHVCSQYILIRVTHGALLQPNFVALQCPRTVPASRDSTNS